LLLGQKKAAGVNYRRAIELLESLPDTERAGREIQRQIADYWNRLGLLANSSADWSVAGQSHQKARNILEELARVYPNDGSTQADLAHTVHLLGVVSQFTGKLDEAERLYLQEAAIYAALGHNYWEVESYQIRVSDNQVNLALIYQTSKREPMAVSAYAKAETALRALNEKHPTDGEYKLSLAAVYSNWGIVLRETGSVDEGVVKLTLAIELIEKVLEQEPNHQTARLRGYNAHGGRAQAYEAMKHWADAVKDWDRVVALDSNPNPWARRALRAVALARAGEHVRATTEAAALGLGPGITTDGLYNLVVVCAISVNSVQKDTRLESAERKKLADRYASQAVALLQLLRSKNYFQEAANVLNLQTDHDLESLRGRDDFKKLLTDVTPKK
jgi:tetratricopeptide (TPR) repeat protein